jgi:hypothetical protein
MAKQSKCQGTTLQGTVVYKLPYHVAWEDTSTTSPTDYLKTIGIEVFAWESNGVPTWCKDEHGTPFSVNMVAQTLN